MSTLVIMLRVISILAFAGPMLLGAAARRREHKTQARRGGSSRAPLLANLAAFGLFVVSLLTCASSSAASRALPLALAGCVLALAGMAIVLRSRAELGASWSFLPRADQDTDLVTTGPYRLVRHPIYLGFVLLATGQALAFSSLPALLIVLAGLVPTFAWRARTEETALSGAFGERYADYQRRTKMIIPHLL